MNTTKTEQTRKANYVNAWTGYVKDLYSLALCSDENMSKEVVDCIKRLEAVIPKIADTKKHPE